MVTAVSSCAYLQLVSKLPSALRSKAWLLPIRNCRGTYPGARWLARRASSWEPGLISSAAVPARVIAVGHVGGDDKTCAARRALASVS